MIWTLNLKYSISHRRISSPSEIRLIFMRKSYTQKIDLVIREFLSEIQIDRKLKEVHLVSEWESLMGKMVASRTQHIYIRNKTLFIHVTSSVLKNELVMMRQNIMDRLNEIAGEKLVEQIVFK
jgi:predicted nucleic acid-binding Zn ribbon protein